MAKNVLIFLLLTACSGPSNVCVWPMPGKEVELEKFMHECGVHNARAHDTYWLCAQTARQMRLGQLGACK